MNENLKNKLLREIKKTGYPLELQVGNIFSKQGWRVDYNRYYLDRDEQKGREIDISAYTNAYYDEGSVSVDAALHLICEVKRSAEKPWIVFSTKKRIVEGGGWFKLHYANEVSADLLHGNEITKGSSLSRFSRIGRSYYEGFGANHERSVIFKALTSVVKASEYWLERNLEASADFKIKGHKEIGFVDPVTVLDGLLYEAYLNEKDELKLDEIEHILVSFGYISSEYHRRAYLVDIVTIKELPNLLLSKKEWIHGIKDTIVNKLKQKG